MLGPVRRRLSLEVLSLCAVKKHAVGLARRLLRTGALVGRLDATVRVPSAAPAAPPLPPFAARGQRPSSAAAVRQSAVLAGAAVTAPLAQELPCVKF